MNLIDIEIQNFISYKYLKYKFEPISLLIQGINLTDHNQESNGTGKTAFQAAVEYCLYGNSSQKIRDQDIVRIGEKYACLILNINCSIRKEVLTIKRVINKSISNKLELFINKTKVKKATINDGNNLIIDWLGISKYDLQNYYIINRERYQSFFNSSNTEKIKIISRFSNANIVDKIFPIIDNEIKNLSIKIHQLQLNRAKNEGIIESLKNELLENTKEIFDKNKSISLIEINEQIKKIEVEKEKNDNKIKLELHEFSNLNHKLSNYIESIKTAKKELKKIDIKKYEHEIELKQLQINQIQKKCLSKKLEKDDKNEYLSKIELQLKGINLKLLSSVICPNCEYEFYPDDLLTNVANEKEKYKKVKKEITGVLNTIDLISSQIHKQSKQVSQEIIHKSKLEQIKSNIQKDIIQLESQINSFNFKIENIHLKKKSILENINIYKENNKVIDRMINDYKFKYEEVKKENFNIKIIEQIKKKIENQNLVINECNKEIDILEQSKAISIQWQINFKSFKEFLASRFLNVIEGLSNYFIEMLKSDLQIKWEGYKLLADGSFSEKITPLIIREGVERDFNSYSGGEKARLEFSLILTIRDLINKSHPYNGLEFLFADEIFEGLDPIGLNQLMKSINTFHYPILITTHITKNNFYDQTITIMKENGISRIA